jgi:glyoxylase-like metal-dependent hydrolase (beta-lactamase superfamily II)
MGSQRPSVEGFFHKASNTISYLVWDPAGLRAAIIDPALDFKAASGEAGTAAVDAIIDRAEELGLTVDWSLETHVHADHLSAARRVVERTGAKTAIGAGVGQVQAHFGPMFGIEASASDCDRLLGDGDRLPLGELEGGVMAVPGHTPADVAYHVGDALFVGDSLFMPDYGSARCDFPGGSARAMYRSIRKLLSLPDETRMFLCHDYKAPGREEFAWETSIGEQRRHNLHLHDGVGEEEFVALREGRDATLDAPAMLLPALQVNIRGGRVPDMLRLPVTWEG